MNRAIELFSQLGMELAEFGNEPTSRRVIAQACEANMWFGSNDICRAVAAVREEMLQRDKLQRWLSNYPTPVIKARQVLVVAAGNIPLVGFFDLLCVVAAGHDCLIKPSSKDEVLMRYMLDRMQRIDHTLSIAYYKEGDEVDAVIATGSDNTNRYFKTQFAGIPSLLRGSRQSVAVLSGDETPEQLHGLEDDIFAYSGLGCRNVSLIFVPRGYDLHIQAPAMNEKYKHNYTQVKALFEMSGKPFRDLSGAVLTEEQVFPTVLSQINYAVYESQDQVIEWLAKHNEKIQCVVTESLAHPRRANFGSAQSPMLTDYPDQCDVMQFLIGI